MINFRYHVVSIVAIFLALGFGLLFGVTFLDESVVDSLQRQQQRLGNRNEELHQANAELDERLEKMAAFADTALPLLVRGTLADRVVVLITFEETADSSIEQAVATLTGAGARVDGVVAISDGLDMSTDERRRQAAVIAESPSADISDVRNTLAEKTVEALAGRAPGFLQRVADNGGATVREVQGVTARPLRELAAPGSAIVILPPDEIEEDLRENFVLPVLRRISQAQLVSVVTDEGEDISAILRLIRQDSTLRLMTVDAAETAVGKAALSLGLEAAFAGRFGHYGVGEGASFILPEQPAA